MVTDRSLTGEQRLRTLTDTLQQLRQLVKGSNSRVAPIQVVRPTTQIAVSEAPLLAPPALTTLTPPQATLPPLPIPPGLAKLLDAMNGLSLTILRLDRRLELLQTQLATPSVRSSEAVVTREDLLQLDITTGTVGVGNSQDFDVQPKDLNDKSVTFSLISITQVEIISPELASTDAVRLRLYPRGNRDTITAEFAPTASDLTPPPYQAAFSNRRIEYRNEDGLNQIHGTIRNNAGNSGSATFRIRLFGRRFPDKEGR